MGAVVYLQAEIDRRRERAAGKAEGERRPVYDPIREEWTDWSEVERFKAVSHRSVHAFEAARNNRQLPRFLGKFKRDAGRDPLDSLCQFGAVCAATQAVSFAALMAATIVAASAVLNQSQVLLRHALSLRCEVHSRKGDGNCLSPIHRSSPGVHP